MRRIRELALLLGRVKTIWIIFLLGLTIRVGITLWLGNRLLPLADQPVFLDMAENIATGHGLSVSSKVVGMPENISDSLRAVLMTRPERMRDERLGALWGVILPDKPTAFFEPFYPFFVGGIRWIFGPSSGTHLGLETIPFGPKITIVRLFQSLFDALVIPILFYLGSALFTPVVGGLASLIYCFYPYSIVFVTNIVTQNTYLFLQAVMVFFFVRTMKNQNWFNYLALGLTAGLTLLTRISLITFIPFIIICLYLPLRRNLKWGRLAVSLTIMVAAVVPWLIRNNAVFGEPLLLPTKGGRNLWEYNNQIFTPEKMEGRFTGVDALYQRFALANYDRLKAKDLIAFPEFTTETEPERDRVLNERVQGFIKANPVVYAKLCGLRLYQLFRVIPRHLGGPLSTLAALLSFGWILPTSLLGLALSLKGPWQERSVLYGLIFYTVATSTLTASGIPHRLPTDPYFILLAAFCVVKVLKLNPSMAQG